MGSRNAVKGSKFVSSHKLVISSGIPSLDYVLGGGIPLESAFLVEEDLSGGYSKTMLKYFLSEGIVMEHKLLFASMDSDVEKFISELPAVTNVDESKSNVNDKLDDEIQIAWRYKSMAPVGSMMKTESQFSHYYDLATKIDTETLKKSSISLFGSTQCQNIDDNSSKYSELIKFIKSNITDLKENDANNVLRIAIESLASPFWQHCESANHRKEIYQLKLFLIDLKCLLVDCNVVVFMTIPIHLFEQAETVFRIRNLVHTSVRLDSFAGTSRENNPALKDYHGLFHIHKIFDTKNIGAESRIFDLAFKLRRKKFVIEKLHLPPELQESAEREQDDLSTGCGSARNAAIDF